MPKIIRPPQVGSSPLTADGVFGCLRGTHGARKITSVILTSACETHDFRGYARLGGNRLTVKPVDFQWRTDAVRSLGVCMGRSPIK